MDERLLFCMVILVYCRLWEYLDFFIHTHTEEIINKDNSGDAPIAPKNSKNSRPIAVGRNPAVGHSQKAPIFRAESPMRGAAYGNIRGGSYGNR